VNNYHIPKKIHLAWKNKNIFDDDSALIVYGVKQLRDLNPDWQIEITVNEEIEDYLNEKMRQDFTFVEHQGIVAKTDIWRLYKMFYEGGLYVDIDRFCDAELSKVIPDGIKQILPICRTYDFAHDLMISAPNNPVFSTAISMYTHRRKIGYTNIYFLGAQTYMHAITYTLFGKMINTNPAPEVFKQVVEKIKEIDSIYLYEENPPYQTFLCRNFNNFGDWEQLKRNFYNKNHIKHWTGDW